ncbi:urea carboxylase-associated family protein [Bacillus sp. JJ1532]|uniref:urea carboxylase-associated family protein n=1 Tax=Bacillus sp. JJ1532 TaxID=3122958 RepID=UPI0030002616
MEKREFLIPGGTGRSFIIKKGEFLKVIDVEGKQVADFIAISLDKRDEYLSTAHTRTMNGRLFVTKGDKLFSNYRHALLEMVEDTIGVHDTLYPCCDPQRYKLDFNVENHKNCRDNFAEALKEYEIVYGYIPDPLNLFQNSPINHDGTFAAIVEPESKPGDYVVFKALSDLIIGISACPQDMVPTNGYSITDIKAEILNSI